MATKEEIFESITAALEGATRQEKVALLDGVAGLALNEARRLERLNLEDALTFAAESPNAFAAHVATKDTARAAEKAALEAAAAEAALPIGGPEPEEK